MATWDEAEHLTFTRRTDADGVERVTVARWPPVIAVEGRFLDQADPHVARRRLASNTISFVVANGAATYGIVAFERDVYLCEHLAGMGDAAG